MSILPVGQRGQITFLHFDILTTVVNTATIAPKKLSVLTRVCQAAKKSGRNNQVPLPPQAKINTSSH